MAERTGADGAELVEVVAAALQSRLAELTGALRDRLATRIEELDGDAVIIDLLYASIEGNIENILNALRHDIPLDKIEPPSAAYEYARRLAQRGVPVSALVRAYRLGQQNLLELVFAECDRLREGTDVPEPTCTPALMAALRTGDPHELAPQLSNDLQAAAVSLRPDLGETLTAGMEYGALGGIVSMGDTPLYQAVDTYAAQQAASWSGDRINAIVLLSDGENDAPNAATIGADQMLANLKNLHHSTPVLVFTLAYGADADVATLQSISSATGAHYYDATDPSKLEAVLGDLVTSF